MSEHFTELEDGDLDTTQNMRRVIIKDLSTNTNALRDPEMVNALLRAGKDMDSQVITKAKMRLSEMDENSGNEYVALAAHLLKVVSSLPIGNMSVAGSNPTANDTMPDNLLTEPVRGELEIVNRGLTYAEFEKDQEGT